MLIIFRALRDSKELLNRLHEALESEGFDQKPRLSSSQKFGAGEKSFSLCEGATCFLSRSFFNFEGLFLKEAEGLGIFFSFLKRLKTGL